MYVTDAYIVDESIGLKSMTRRPMKIIAMMTKAVTQNQEKIFTKRRCTGTRSRKRKTLDLKVLKAFFSHQPRYPAGLGAKANLERVIRYSGITARNHYSLGHA